MGNSVISNRMMVRSLGVIFLGLVNANEIKVNKLKTCENHPELQATTAKTWEVIGTDESMIWLSSFEDQKLNYYQAQEFCSKYKGNLWCPDREEEYHRIIQTFDRTSFSWLGIKRVDGEWMCDHHEHEATSPLEFQFWDQKSSMAFPTDTELYSTVFGFGVGTMTKGAWHNTNPQMAL